MNVPDACRLIVPALAAALLSVGTASSVRAQQEVTIGYMKHPIHEASVDIIAKHAEERGISLKRVPMPYGAYLEKITASLTSGGDQFDIVWHNDDWGPIWHQWLAPTDDIEGMKNVDQSRVDIAFLNDDGKPTVVPMVHTIGVFFYRTDLLEPEEVPQTWDEMVQVSKRLQDEGKVKWGFVGSMAMNHTWATWLWSMWSNNCDIFEPVYARTKTELEANNFETMLDAECNREVVEFWWDNINKHKISPPAMPSYTVDDANAIFMAGDAAFTATDSSVFGKYNDPATSRVAGNVGIARFPKGPRRDTSIAWNSFWGWAVPKGLPAERQELAKALLNDMLMDVEGNIQLFERTGGPPPNMESWDQLAEQNEVFQMIKTSVMDLPETMHGTYYFENWPAVHKAYSDTVIGAVTGAREDIPKVLEDGNDLIHRVAIGEG